MQKAAIYATFFILLSVGVAHGQTISSVDIGVLGYGQALKGVKSVSLTIHAPDNIQATIEADVRIRFRGAGLRVVGPNEKSEHGLVLGIQTGPIKNGAVGWCCETLLWERDVRLQNGNAVDVIVFNNHDVGTLAKADLTPMRETASQQIDHFLAIWMRVNPQR